MGRAYDGWTEIDAYGWRPPPDTSGERRQVCVEIELKGLAPPMPGSCFGSGQIEQPIAIESIVSLVKPKRLRDREIGGALSPDVARVEVLFQRPGHKEAEAVEATVAQVSGQLQRELGQPSPFGYFFAKVRGRVPSEAIRAVAYDASGTSLGSTSGLQGPVVPGRPSLVKSLLTAADVNPRAPAG